MTSPTISIESETTTTSTKSDFYIVASELPAYVCERKEIQKVPSFQQVKYQGGDPTVGDPGAAGGMVEL